MNEIKIGISGNPIGEGGYNNLVNVDFDAGLLERQFSYKGTHNNEYSIEVQQGDTEAIYILVLNPLYVYSSGASRGGALCIFLSIPARKYMLKRTPLKLLRDNLEKFRNENMIKTGDVWEYQYKACYDRESFLNLSKQVEIEGLAELPTYVQMEGDSELLVSIGDKLEAFFEGDFQYPKFKGYNRLVIADHIDGSTWKPTEIPRPWSLAVYYGSSFVATLDSSNPEISHKFSPAPSDADIYDETEIKLRLDGYNVEPTGCKVNVKWNDGKIEIKSIQWNLRQIFVPITIEGIDSLSPDEIVCNFSENPKVVIPAKKKPDEVLGFEFRGTQIRAVKKDMFHINNDSYNDSYNFTVELVSVKGLPEEVHIKAEHKQKFGNDLEQDQAGKADSQEFTGGNSDKEGVPSYTKIKAGIEAQSQSQPDTKQLPGVPENTAYTLINGTGETLEISVGVVDDKGNIDTEKSITPQKESEGKPDDSKLKFYRKKEFWIGLVVGLIFGIILGFGMGFLTRSVYSNLSKSDYKEVLHNDNGALFIYTPEVLETAINILNSAESSNNKNDEFVVISNQTEHFKNLLYNLEDNGYKLKFEDPAIIKKWVENEKIDSLGITDIDNIKKCIDAYSKFGDFFNTVIKSENRSQVWVDMGYRNLRELLKPLSDELKDSELLPIRKCIQAFYLQDDKSVLQNKDLHDSIFVDNQGQYSFTPQCFKDIYDKVK